MNSRTFFDSVELIYMRATVFPLRLRRERNGSLGRCFKCYTLEYCVSRPIIPWPYGALLAFKMPYTKQKILNRYALPGKYL